MVHESSDCPQLIEMAIGGKAISTVFEGEKRFDVAVRFQEPARADADAIGNILIPTHDGGRVPLSQLARIEVVNGASIIARRENIRQISVRTNIRGRDQGSFVKEAQAKFEKAVQLPPGYSVDWGGQFENLERARKRLRSADVGVHQYAVEMERAREPLEDLRRPRLEPPAP